MKSMALKNLVGQKFNMLTVVEKLPNRVYIDPKGKQKVQRYWRCKCDCGEFCEKTTHGVTHTMSCGCRQKTVVKAMVQKVFPGDRYGFLTVLHFEKDPSGTSAWRCQCFCGSKPVIVRTRNLRDGLTKSCGCMSSSLRNETFYANHPFDPKKSKQMEVLYSYRKSARVRELKFELSEEEFFSLINKPCVYCGLEPNPEILKYSGVDRLDSAKGYSTENCWPACALCNFRKNDSTIEEFEKWLDRISAFKKEKGWNFSRI